jgi:hypothetical protein
MNSLLLFLPIDIDMSGVNFTQFDKSVKLTAYNPYWESTQITKDTIVKNDFDKILNQLPFTEISVVTYKIQQSIVNSHVDVYPSMNFKDAELEHIRAHEPAGYRFVLNGNSDSVEVFNGQKWITAYTPNVPCCYLINSTMAKHRVKEDFGRTIIYVRGILDPEKHQSLITLSYNKYKDYAIELIK